ncbi:sodium-dependent transporter bedraggled isoform X2 [Drosophila sulfurigaster albostrigata]|uniref:sodium-dependent transporter bedraggled isoform X2 n=1 Tax=Drosophila sulfurigaster albostrigata TaxID=89887 RepID=UPI002D2197CE|nr:sodium-dependent transporter bedraggled isoform X2 [Drosophila sulfurigaster albostrigata]XP_062136577.1 sodium-dependent transporter bedraggled isoform X2 [Drosophila sulfurigaster albostrigata]
MNGKEQSAGREFKRNSNAYASLPATTKTTIKEKRKESLREPECYGLSHSLSSESIKQACDYYDDEPSDEDLIEIHQTPQGFHHHPRQQQQLQAQQQQHPLSFSMPLADDGERNALCDVSQEAPLSTPIKPSATVPDEALSVLNELDAILDVHGASPLNGSNRISSCGTSSASSSSSDDDKVEDYLMDLDNYLEELDKEDPLAIVGHPSLSREPRTRTLPLSRKRKQHKQSDEEVHPALDSEFQRGHQMRKTFSCGLTPTGIKATSNTSLEAGNASVAQIDVWRRQSMRRAIENDDAEAKAENVDANASAEEDDEQPPTLLVTLPSQATTSAASSTSEMRRSFSQPESLPQREGSALQMLTEAHIFDNLLQNEQRTARAVSEQLEQRPRQYGRRFEGHPSMSPARNMGLVSPLSRPQSAPAQAQRREAAAVAAETPTHAMMSPLCSEMSSARSSRIPSPVSLVSSGSGSSSDSSTVSTGPEQDQLELGGQTQTTICSASSGGSSTTPLEPQLLREKCGFNSQWPHAASRTLALMGCTLGVFNLCRFAVLTINYGGNFLLQFLLLSVIFGIPLFWLQMCLGAKIKSGPVSMWKISPICSGVGIALVMVQCFLAIYSTVAVGWILIYLRDVFPTPSRSVYRWQELAFPYRYDAVNDTGNLTHTVAEYFNIVVLQRLHLAKHPDATGGRFHVNDRQLAFYLALIWAAVFLILCKGLKSLGKLAFLINTLPLIALLVVTGKFVSIVDPAILQDVFGSSDFDDFLVNSNTWTAATQETFLTWGLLGASVIDITSRTHANASKTTLRRDAILMVLLTLLGLGLAALLALCCAQILRQHGYVYVPGSFERPDCYTSVYSLQAQTNPQLLSYPRSLVPHYSSFLGETYRRNKTILHIESGFQALRFITELFPAVLSLSSDAISWVWAAVAFAMFAGFGLAQLCVMWKPISSAMGNSTSSVLLSCVTGLLLSIPFATDMGISILYYVDFLLGGSWFIPIIWAAQIFGVFLIRGRPYNGDDLVNDLRMCGSMSAFLALSWNVLLPIGLITLSVIDYKASLSNQFYYWRGKSYFSYASRKTGSLIQIGIVLIIPVTAIIQIYRYLTQGPPDILERIQLLYRPQEEGSAPRRPSARQRSAQERRNATSQQQESGHQQAQNDAPPKYTPPPSYTTATGARLAKLLRQSIRRSVRRVLGDSSSRTRPILSLDAESPSPVAPPDYLTILTNPSGSGSGSGVNAASSGGSSSPESIEIGQRPAGYAQRSQSLGRKLQRPTSASGSANSGASATLERGSCGPQQQRPYTAEDVVTILRSSVRHRPQPRQAVGMATTLPRPPAMSTHLEDASFRSIENLVLNAEPPDQTPGVGSADGGGEQEQCGQNNNNTSVI